MFKHTSRIETILRIGLMLVLLLNACGPAGKNKQVETIPPAAPTATQPRILPTNTPEYYQPPNYVPPVQNAVTATKPIVNLPPEKPAAPIAFSITASPAMVVVGDSITLEVRIKNNTSKPIANPTYTDILEPGLEFVPNSSNTVSFNVSNKQVSYTVASLEPGDEASFSYKVRATEYNRNDQNGELWLHSVSLKDQGTLDLSAQGSFVVGKETQDQGSIVAAVPQNGGWASLGQVSVYMQPGSLKQNSILVASPVKKNSSSPVMQFALKTIGIGNLAKDSKGTVAEQKTAVEQESSGKFAVPAFLEVNMDSVTNLADIPAGQEPFIATYDEKNQVWVKVPILKTDYGTNTLTVEAAHFSTWGAGLGASMPQNGTGALLFDQPYTSLFTGAARYSIPIWTPTGRAGMTPSISLSYSSGTVDGVLGDVQAPWVGEGWNIDSTEIVRKITTNDNGYGYGNSYSLTVNGSLYELIRDTYDPTRYYVKDSGFLYVKLHNYALGNQQDSFGANPSNTSGEWWEVVTTDGTRYRLGWNQDSEQLALMYSYSCSTGNPCTTPDGAYASSGYAGKADNLVARRWRVDRVTDRNGNYMTYSYTEVHPDAPVPPFDRASYLTTISYTGFDGIGNTPALQPGYQVSFVLSDRSQNEDVPNQFNVWDIYDSKKLDRIEVSCLACSTDPANAPIRTVELNYSVEAVPNDNGTLTLTKLITHGGGFTENETLIPTTYAADVKFTYGNMVNRDSGNGDQFSYPRLTQIDNGYGAKLTYTYEDDGRSNTSWYNYRVKNVQVDSGLGTAVKRKYTYQSPAYEDLWNSPNLGALVGYATVTEASLDFNNGDADILDTIHQFGTEDPDKGHELSSEASGEGTVWKKTVNTYITDNSAATSPAWNYRYLARVESFVHGSGDPADTPSLTSMTTYYNDPATGNLLLQSDYLGAALYRKTYYEYAVNTDPAFYILNKVSRKLLVDTSNQVYSDTYYYYDNGEYGSAPTKGLLTQTQTRTGNSPDEVVNATTDYDAYGNPQDNKVYSEFGTLKGGLPNTSIQSSVTYDSPMHIYPVTNTNAMDEETKTSYFYSLGVPYQAIDANDWVTTTSYDGLGRTLAVIPPGFDPGQAGMAYIYPQPSGGSVAAPYYIEMQIFDPRCSAQGCYRSVWGFYDGLGRIIQNQLYDADHGYLLVTDMNFNAQGLAWRQSLQHSVNTPGGNYIAPDWNNLDHSYQEYDMLGRQTRAVTPAGSQTLTSYDGLTTTVTDPNGNQKSQTTDGLGRLVQLGEYTGTTLYATTQYSNDIADRQVQTTDAQANVTTIAYNMLGQKTGMHDPDMGVWTYVYDARGNLVQQTDGNSQTLTFSYDSLGRMQQKNNGSQVSYYYYDGLTSENQSTPIPGEIGMRTSMIDQSGSTTWSYFDNGHRVIQDQKIGGITKSFTTVSDWLGRPFTATNPDGETITYTYDALGRPLNFSSDDYQGITLASLAYNDVGQIASIALGKPDSGNAVATVDNQYDLNQRLTLHKAGNNEDDDPADAHNNFMNFTYAYDANGNITSLVDNTLNETSVYKYDSMNRLASADVYTGTPTPASYQFLYRKNYEYDKIGNLLQVGSFGTGTGMAALPGQPAVTVADGWPSLSSDTSKSVASLPQASRSLASLPLSNLNFDPIPGSELWDPDAAAFNNGGTYAWTTYENNIVTNDSGSLKIAYVDNPNGAHEYLRDSADLSNDLSNGTWYSFQVDSKVEIGNSVDVAFYRGDSLAGSYSETNTNFTTHVITARAGGGDNSIRMGYMQKGEVIWIDNLSLRAFSPSSLFSSILPSSASVDAQTPVTVIEGTQAGLVTNLDNAAAPGNFLLAYTDGTLIYLDKVVGGVYSNLIAEPISYVSGHEVKVMTDNSSGSLHVTLYYNGEQKGAEQIVNDPLIINNTLVGQFSTYSGNTLGTLDQNPYNTPVPTQTFTATNSPTASPTAQVPTNTRPPTVTSTFTPSPSYSPTRTRTPTPTPTPTKTSTSSNTPTASKTPTLVTYTVTNSKTPTITPTFTFTPTSTTGLMGYWSFDDISGTNVPDDTGRRNNGTLNSGVQQIALGESGSSVRFNGFHPNISISYDTDLAPSGSFSVAAWVKPESIATGRYTRLVERDGVYALRFNQNGYMEFTIWGVTPDHVVGPQLPLDDWTLVAGSYDSASKQMNLYVNGSLVAAATIKGTRSSNSNPMVLGSSASTERFQGQLDEVRFYNYLISASEELGLYNNATATPATTTATLTPVTYTPTRTFTITSSPTYTSSPTFTPSKTPRNTPTGWAPTEGVLDLFSGATFNISTNNTSPRACADGGDGVSYSVTSLAATYAVLSASPSNGCLTQGDEILLINMRGDDVSTANVGHYEFLHVASVNDDTVYFSTPKTLLYGENEYDDSNIGLDTDQQRVVLQRVPNYDNVILNGTLTANAWNGNKYGIIAFRVAGTLSGSGTILADELGYRGGAGGAGNGGWANRGESYGGTGGASSPPNLGGGGAGGNLIGGGGGYGSMGHPSGRGGNTYGDLDLGRLFLGSGGGGSMGNTGGSTNPGKDGGNGGGIVLIAANNIGDQSNTWTGVITSDGGDGADDAGHSGGGSGGSIRIQGNTIVDTTTGDLTALGGSVGDTQRGGGIGRIAVYYQNPPSLSSLDSSPQAGYFPMNVSSTPTATVTEVLLATPTPSSSGTDGTLTIASSHTVNLSISGLPDTRTCADGGAGVAYSLVELASAYAKANTELGYDCLAPGDEVMLINMRGSDGHTDNVGHYEFLHIASVSGDTVYFTTLKTNFYGENAYDDSNIGLDTDQQRVVLQRVPNYNNVILNGTLTANAWNGNKYGIIAFRVAGTLSGSGTILADRLGYRGGAGGASNGGWANRGESYGGTGGASSPPNLGGGGAGGNLIGGGGGYGTMGHPSGRGGNTYGVLDLGRLFLGSGGGGSMGNTGGSTNPGKGGGNGGGIVLIMANNIGDQSNTWTGVITSDGGDGADDAGHSGGGSGGSIRIEGNTITFTAPGNLAALGGSYGDTQRGGGLGRTAVYWRTSFSAGFTPNYLKDTSQNVEDSIFSDSFEIGDLSATPSPWSVFSGDSTQISVAPEAAYWGNYGLAVTINGETPEPYVEDDSPNTEVHYRARFYFNPNGISIPSNGTIDLFRGYSDAVGTTPVLRVQMQKSGHTYQANIGARNDSGSWANSSWNDLTSGWNALEIEYLASHSTGQMSLWVGGVLEQTLTGLDNDGSKVDTVRLGGMGAASGSSGTVYLDDFDSRRISAPGVLADPGLHNRGLYKYTFTSQPDGQTGKDTHIDSKNAGASYSTISMYVGEDPSYTETYRSLLQFDLSSIPANAVVQDASLTLTLTSISGSSARMLCIYLLKRNWDESSATWNNYASGSAWQTAGAGGVNDYDSNPLACVSMTGNETEGKQETWTLPATVLQAMINGSVDNRGFILRATVESNTDYHFASSDNSTAAYRPSLTIDYATDQAVDPWVNRNYTYSPDKPHAVTGLSTGESYSYDANGNMTCRVENGLIYNQVYNAENRLVIVQQLSEGNCPPPNVKATTNIAASWNFIYDGDGNRVRQEYFEGVYGQDITVKMTSYFAGGSYELDQSGVVQADLTIQVAATTTLKYYSFAGQLVAMTSSATSNNPCATLCYFLSDQLGSIIALLDTSGNIAKDGNNNPMVQRYLPFGQVRTDVGTISQTDLGYTGQRNLDAQSNSFSLGLMDYHARFYDEALGRFTQPDSLTPGGPQGLNRYSYAINNPTNYTDPSGNMPTQGCGDDGKSACAPTQQETDQNAAKLVLLQAKAEDHECKAGNEIYCPTVKKHPAEVAAFVITGLVGAAALPEAWAITEAVGWNVATACATSSICWTITGAGGVGAAGAVGNQVGSNQIGRNGVNQVLRTLNDPNALTEQTVTGNGLSGRIDILTNTAMNEVKNVANLSLSQRFMEQAYRYSEIAQANGLELHYWLVNDHPQYIVDWLSRLGVIVH